MCVYIIYYYYIIYNWVLYNIRALYIIYMHMHICFYIYIYTYEFWHFFGTRFLACFHPQSLNISRKWTESLQHPMPTEPQERSGRRAVGAQWHVLFCRGKWLQRQRYTDRLRWGVHPSLPSCTTINFR